MTADNKIDRVDGKTPELPPDSGAYSGNGEIINLDTGAPLEPSSEKPKAIPTLRIIIVKPPEQKPELPTDRGL